MKKTVYFLVFVIVTMTFFSCKKEIVFFPLITSESTFSANENYLLINGKQFRIKGVVYVPAYPGYLPWELAKRKDLPVKLKKSIRKDIKDIKEMGANTVRFWDVPAFCYDVVREIGGLCFIQTIWFPVDADELHDQKFKNECKKIIAEVIDRIYSVYSQEKPPPVLAFLVGNELSERTIEDTDENHPEITSYEGKFVSAPPGSTPSECFLAEMADFVKIYEFDKYGRIHMVSYANEMRTQDIIDTPFLDFRCYNAYPYVIHDYSRPEYTHEKKTGFLAWIEYLKKKHPDVPLLITETGLSVSPEANHAGPPHYGYGGNTENEQVRYLTRAWRDIILAEPPIAGMCIHEYLDAWWKFGLDDSFEHEDSDVEEWFGLVSLEKSGDWYIAKPRKAYIEMKRLWGKKRTSLGMQGFWRL